MLRQVSARMVYPLLVLAGFTMSGGQAMAVDIQEAQLKNGMKVIVVPDHRSAVITHSVWYKVGSVDEPEGQTGISHMLEHLMFKGTKKYGPGEVDKIIQRNGGVQNAFTSREMTAYHQTVAKDKLALVMELEADRMEGLVLSDTIFQPERDVVMEERRLRTDSQPMARFFEKLGKAHFKQHPFGNPVIGWAADIKAYTFERALSWYRKHYAPNNATLIVVGDAEMKDVLPLAEKYYGPIKPMDVMQREDYREPVRKQQVRLIEVDKEVKVPVYYSSYRAPSAFQGVGGGKQGTADAVALEVMAEILGGSDVSRLYQSLVVKQQLADGASSDYDMVSGGESSVDVQVTPRNGVTLDKIEAAVAAEIELLQTKGVTAKELERAKVNLLADDVYAQDDTDGLMYHVGDWLMVGGTPKTFGAWRGDVSKVTAADVKRVAKEYLTVTANTTGIAVGDKKLLGKLNMN